MFFYRVRRDESGDRTWFRIAENALQHGYAAVDAAIWFEGIEAKELANSAVDPNPNASAHKILATGIAETLLRLGS